VTYSHDTPSKGVCADGRFVVTFVVHPVTFPDRQSRTPAAPVVVIIPARFHSTRLPGKALAEIGGLPMIVHVVRGATATRGVDTVVVATDDQRVAAAVERFGGTARLTRADHLSGTDRIAEVAATIDAELIVNLQGDEPMVHPGMIEQVIDALRSGAPMATLRRAISDPAELQNPNVVKVVVDRNDDALYFSRHPIPFVREVEDDKVRLKADTTHSPPTGSAQYVVSGFSRTGGATTHYKHVGIYGYRRDVLLELAGMPPTALELAESLEQLRALEHGIRIRTLETIHDSIGVDTPEDLERVRRLHDRAGVVARP
jgi:3-deoxy-manno-octulosonate cytidylyltransferase (CMP-KDO synthetase)